MHAIQCTLARSLRNEALWKRARLEKPILPAAKELRAFLRRLQGCVVSRQWPESLRGLRLFLWSAYSIRLGLRGSAKRRERQNQSKKEKGIAKHQRLEFHIPSRLQIWIRFPQNASGLPTESGQVPAWPFGERNNFQKWRLAGWGLCRKRLTIEPVKAITDDLKTL